MADIKGLIKKRASIKAKLTLFSTYLNVVKSCEKLSDTQLIEIEQRLNTFESLYEKYDTLQIHLEEAVDEPCEQYAEREEFENLYYALVASARQLVGSARKHLTGDSASEVVSAVVKVSDAAGNLHDARVLLDNGSTANFISEDFCRKLRIHTYPIKSHVSSSIPNTYVDTDNISLPSNLVLADPNFYTPSSIDILVGAEIFWGIIGMNRIPLGKNMPTLVESKLGWLVTGVLQQPDHSSPNISSFVTLTDDLR
uniref:Uncharacterized protein n=1 Tax=Heliothis virescens TaxID=7102 RepID=A0A2A4JED3_HELVI